MIATASHLAPPDARIEEDSIETRARHLLHANPHFRGRADGFLLKHEGDVLTVQGAVRSFYQKQVIQTILSKLHGVRRIDNQVTVAPADHASSARHHAHGGLRLHH